MEDAFHEPDSNKALAFPIFPGTWELLVEKDEQISNGPFLHRGYQRYTGDLIENEEFKFLVMKNMEKMIKKEETTKNLLVKYTYHQMRHMHWLYFGANENSVISRKLIRRVG